MPSLSTEGVDWTDCSFVLRAVYQVITAFFAQIRSTTLGRVHWGPGCGVKQRQKGKGHRVMSAPELKR